MGLSSETLQQTQERLFWGPTIGIEQDIYEIYGRGHIEVGWPEGVQRLYQDIARENTVAFGGLQFGDEGKGRIVDNKLEHLLEVPGIQLAYVIRYQGGSNAGHTVVKDDIKLALHQVPSGVFYPEAIGIMDRDMVIHTEDLKTEIEDVENIVGDLRGKLYLSEDAILVTDLERAEEVLNEALSEGKSAGGTGRGVSPAYAHFYDRRGAYIKDLMTEDWKEKMAARYNQYQLQFSAHGYDLADMNVPDLRATRKAKEPISRKLGTKEEFLDRLESVRTWYIERDQDQEPKKKMITNTFLIHRDIFRDMRNGIVLEGAQGFGLHPWLGVRPDVTSSDTTVHGAMSGTALYRAQDIADRVGVFKITYASKVPDREMPTQVKMPDNLPAKLDQWDAFIEANKDTLTPEQIRAMWIVKYAGEVGTTTGRLRGIHNLDLELMRYNARMGGIEVLAGTHLDCARADEPILVCTHYTKNGKVVAYEPGLERQKGVKPHYIVVPGWDGEAVRNAKSFDEIPMAAKQFLTLVQRRTGFPIVAATTGPSRDNLIEFPGNRYTGAKVTVYRAADSSVF